MKSGAFLTLRAVFRGQLGLIKLLARCEGNRIKLHLHNKAQPQQPGVLHVG